VDGRSGWSDFAGRMALGVGLTDWSPVPVDVPLGVPPAVPLDRGRWPEALVDQRLWAARLRTASESWAEEAGRLRRVVRAPVLSGPCAQALVASGDGLAAEIATLAAELATLTGAGLGFRSGDQR
jgi:hypothetical protein